LNLVWLKAFSLSLTSFQVFMSLLNWGGIGNHNSFSAYFKFESSFVIWCVWRRHYITNVVIQQHLLWTQRKFIGNFEHVIGNFVDHWMYMHYWTLGIVMVTQLGTAYITKKNIIWCFGNLLFMGNIVKFGKAIQIHIEYIKKNFRRLTQECQRNIWKQVWTWICLTFMRKMNDIITSRQNCDFSHTSPW
jgi:hypothetical protein